MDEREPIKPEVPRVLRVQVRGKMASWLAYEATKQRRTRQRIIDDALKLYHASVKDDETPNID